MNLFRKEPEKIRPRSAVVGEWGEDISAAFLKDAGYKILGRNVRPDKRDEIDVVVRDKDTLVFVEVKTRKSENFGSPVSAVKEDKRHALNRAAAAFLRKADYPDMYYRFDVIEVIGEPEDDNPEVRHIENAFPFEKRFKFPV